MKLMIEQAEGLIRPYARLDQILGHAIVHEIGHVLLNLESHSKAGIIRDTWDFQDLQNAYHECLLFTPQQAEALRAEIARRSRLQEVPGVTWTRNVPPKTPGTPRQQVVGAGQ